MTSAPAIGFEYRPSRRMRGLLIAVAALASLAIWLSALPSPGCAGLMLVALAAAARAALRFERSPVLAAGLAGDGGWSLRLRDGQDVAASLGSYRVVSERYLWLQLRVPGLGHAPMLLGPDNSDADTRRRLRMRLGQAQ